MLRHVFLFLSQNKTLTKFAKAYGKRLGARRFVAGDTIESAVKTVKRLNRSGLCATIDYLGEYAASEKKRTIRSQRNARKPFKPLPNINWSRSFHLN